MGSTTGIKLSLVIGSSKSCSKVPNLAKNPLKDFSNAYSKYLTIKDEMKKLLKFDL